jgi:hypothetical protein
MAGLCASSMFIAILFNGVLTGAPIANILIFGFLGATVTGILGHSLGAIWSTTTAPPPPESKEGALSPEREELAARMAAHLANVLGSGGKSAPQAENGLTAYESLPALTEKPSPLPESPV